MVSCHLWDTHSEVYGGLYLVIWDEHSFFLGDVALRTIFVVSASLYWKKTRMWLVLHPRSIPKKEAVDGGGHLVVQNLPSLSDS